jgi:hypothetical protein
LKKFIWWCWIKRELISRTEAFANRRAPISIASSILNQQSRWQIWTTGSPVECQDFVLEMVHDIDIKILSSVNNFD